MQPPCYDRSGILLETLLQRNGVPDISRASLSLAFVATLLATTAAATADQPYDVRGQDVYRIGSSGATSRVSYDGAEMLTVERRGKQARFEAQARYVRTDGGGKRDATARFVQELVPGGTFEDRFDEDPDFLTVLNQPFAVQLDPVTMRDLLHLHTSVPFNATSPLGGDAVLRGYLRPGVGGEIAGRPAVAVRFEAQGPMSGELPGGHGTMSGRMRMDGTAYYALDDALLLALDATLTIHAQLKDSAQAVPVQISYRRYIRARPRTG
jgi:hypothetical protein